MDKFGRTYRLLIEKKDGTVITVEPPFTVEFDIHRNSLSSANVGKIRIYNLAPDNRNQIRKNQYDYQDQRTITFYAGYGKNMPLAFTGSITQAWSVREGNNMVTQIESFDGGFAYINALTNTSFPNGVPKTSIIDSLVKNLPGVKVGAIGDYQGQITRGSAYSGSTPDLLVEITGGGFFIDNGKANCLNDNECLESDIPLINAQSGLLGTPVLEQQYINFEMLFEPGLKVAQLIQLVSETESLFSGTHKVLSLQHRGVISPSVSGSATTSVGLLPGVFTSVPEVQQ